MKPNDIDPEQKQRIANCIDTYINALFAGMPQLRHCVFDAEMGGALLNLAAAHVHSEYAKLFTKIARDSRRKAVSVFLTRGLIPVRKQNGARRDRKLRTRA